jgi:serine phosphatase RsbU (regulator of sigma subunit)
MLMVQSATVALARSNPKATPRDLISAINEVLFDNIRTRLQKDDHVTFTLFRYAPNGRLTFAGAHEDIIVVRKRTGVAESIRPPGTWLGARRDIRRVTVDSILELEDGDLFVLYTDGVTEAMDRKRKQFGLDRLCAIVEKHATLTSEEIRDTIVREVRAWMHVQHDDISVFVARYRAPGQANDGPKRGTEAS